MTRLEAFESLKDHAWLGRLWARLTPTELMLCRQFINNRMDLSRGDFETELNRMFLDVPKPKHHTRILELLACANTMANDKGYADSDFEYFIRQSIATVVLASLCPVTAGEGEKLDYAESLLRQILSERGHK